MTWAYAVRYVFESTGGKLLAELTRAGGEGWELVQILPACSGDDPYHHVQLILKRPGEVGS